MQVENSPRLDRDRRNGAPTEELNDPNLMKLLIDKKTLGVYPIKDPTIV